MRLRVNSWRCRPSTFPIFYFSAFSNIERRTYEHYKRGNQLVQGYKTLCGNKYSKNMEFILKRIRFFLLQIVAKYDDRGEFIDLRVNDNS
jgi:hypothetical protein